MCQPVQLLLSASHLTGIKCTVCRRRILTPYEAKSLVAMLHSRDPLMLERSLVTVSNSAAFTANQVRDCAER